MNAADAIALLKPALPSQFDGAMWADLGAGQGTFTRALATLIGSRGHVYAVDRERSAVAALGRVRGGELAPVTAVLGDFAALGTEHTLALPPLDGILLANALHFVPAADQPSVLTRLTRWLQPNGRLVLIEYESRQPSRWVPYPLSFDRLGTMLPATMTSPARVATRASAFGGTMYVACSVLEARR